MKAAEIKVLSTEDIKVKLEETRKKYQNIRLIHSVSPLENPIQLRNYRKIIARLATELTKREKKS